MIILPLHLQEHEKTAITSFLHRLCDFLGDDLCQLWLFGSKARGDFHEDSDIDLLVVLRDLNSERRGIIRRLAARISLDYDTLINTHLYEEARWEAIVTHRDTLWREVQRDGILLNDLIRQPAP
jgi:predicted nucleotidyltransferase